jgi:hypothetical protein
MRLLAEAKSIIEPGEAGWFGGGVRNAIPNVVEMESRAVDR